ncbi:unnamed protein product, partial [Amoebophrya sp. A25]
ALVGQTEARRARSASPRGNSGLLVEMIYDNNALVRGSTAGDLSSTTQSAFGPFATPSNAASGSIGPASLTSTFRGGNASLFANAASMTSTGLFPSTLGTNANE